MGAKLSDAMVRARELLKAGSSAAEAARVTGLGKSAISMDPVCKGIIEQNRGAKMRQVDDYVRRGVTVKGACAEFGVTASGYSKWKKRENEKLVKSAQAPQAV